MLPALLALAAFGGGTYKAVNSDTLGMPIVKDKEPGFFNDWRSVGGLGLAALGVAMGGQAGAAAVATGLGLGMSYGGTEITRWSAEEQMKQLGPGTGPGNKAPLASPFNAPQAALSGYGWGPVPSVAAMGWTPSPAQNFGCGGGQPVPMHERAPGPYVVPFYAGAGGAPLAAPF